MSYSRFDNSGLTNLTGPVGINSFLRNTSYKTESFTFSADSLPLAADDGTGNLRKVLHPGTAISKITSGPNADMYGARQAAGTAEVQRLTGGGTISGGTFTITYSGQTTAAIAWNANAAAVEAALEALSNLDPYEVSVTGGPIASSPFDITFKVPGGDLATDVSEVTVDVTNLTGAGAAITPSTVTPGVAGPVDGRGTVGNLVGINLTYLPWQLLDHDVEIAVVVEGRVYQDRCYEYNAAGVLIPMSDTTAAGLVAQKQCNILFA